MSDVVPVPGRPTITDAIRNALADVLGNLARSRPDGCIVIERLTININVAAGGGASVNVIEGVVR